MVIEDDPSKALQNVDSLKIHDFAFGESNYLMVRLHSSAQLSLIFVAVHLSAPI